MSPAGAFHAAPVTVTSTPTMEKITGVAVTNTGSVVVSPTVTVYIAGTTTAINTVNEGIFQNNVTLATITDPFTGGTDGSWYFYLGNGRYDVVLSASGATFNGSTTSDILVYDPSGMKSLTTQDSTTAWAGPVTGTYAWPIAIFSGAFGYLLKGILYGTNKSGQWLTVVNANSLATITINNEDLTASAANRILTGTGGNVVLSGDQSRTLVYDSVSSRWRIIS